MKEQIITLRTAQLAKKRGYDAIGWKYYDKGGHLIDSQVTMDNSHLYVTLAPTQDELHTWLREQHNIWVTISFGYKIEWNVWQPKSGYIWNMKEPTLNGGLHCSYEKAFETGLQRALKLIQ